MFTTADQLADARANAKIFTMLMLGGSIAGALLTFGGLLLLLPDAFRQHVTMFYALEFNLARLPTIGAWLAPGYTQIRDIVQANFPDLMTYLDALPARVAIGAGVGAVALPSFIAGAISIAHKRATNRQANGDAKRGIGRFL